MSNKRRPVKNRDQGWVQQAFMLKPGSITNAEHTRRIYSDAVWSYIDTTLGGNFSLNNIPQYTKTADIKTGGLTSTHDAQTTSRLFTSASAADTKDVRISGKMDEQFLPNIGGSKGVGRFWYEQHQQNSVYVYMRFGVPSFTSLAQFFGSFYNHGAASMARKGLVSKAAYTMGEVLGKIALLPFQPFILGGRALRFWTDMPNTKFYTLKPDMTNYWYAANSIANAIAVNIGLIPTWSRLGTSQYSQGEGAAAKTVYAEYLEAWHQQTGGENSSLLGDYSGTFLGAQHNFSQTSGTAGSGGIWTDDGNGVDIRAIALRGQGLALKHLKLREQYMEKKPDGRLGDFREAYLKTINAIKSDKHHLSQPMEHYINSYLEMKYYNLEHATDENDTLSQMNFSNAAYNDGADLHLNETYNANMEGGQTARTGNFGTDSTDSSAIKDTLARVQQWVGSAAGYTRITMDEGGEFICFRVENPGTMSESFSTTTREPDVASKINSTSTSMRNMRFNVSGGLGETFNKIVGFVGDVAMGGLDSIGLSGLATLAGNGFVDIPDMVDQTTAQLPTATYTIPLRSPYGNPLSMMHRIYIPLSCILAGALPKSTGPASYTSPFICQLFSKGRQLTRLGVIKSLTISRGQGNIGWTHDGRPMGIDVTFEVADLSKVLHMPIAAKLTSWDTAVGFVGEALGAPGIVNSLSPSMYNEDSSYTDYLAVLGSLGIQETLLSNNARWAIKVANRRANLSSQYAPSALALWASEDTLIGRAINGATGFYSSDR